MSTFILILVPVLVVFVIAALTFIELSDIMTLFSTRKKIRDFTVHDVLRLLPLLFLLSLVTAIGLITDKDIKWLLLLSAVCGFIGVVFAWRLYCRLPHIMDLPWNVAAARVLPLESIELKGSGLEFFVSGALQERIEKSPDRFTIEVFRTPVGTKLVEVRSLYEQYLAHTGHCLVEVDELETINRAYQRLAKDSGCDVACFGTFAYVEANVFSFHLIGGNSATGAYLIVSDVKEVLELPPRTS